MQDSAESWLVLNFARIEGPRSAAERARHRARKKFITTFPIDPALTRKVICRPPTLFFGAELSGVVGAELLGS